MHTRNSPQGSLATYSRVLIVREIASHMNMGEFLRLITS